MPTLEPRKIPRQGRSRATVDAILDACAEGLISRGYEALTTNSISERAGVSIGTLYEYFPNRDAVGAALAARAFRRMVRAMRGSLDDCISLRLNDLTGTEHMLLTGLKVLIEEQAVYRVMVGQAPHLLKTAEVIEAQRVLIELSQEVRGLAGDRLNLPMPEEDAWLIAHMLSATMLQIAFLEASDEQRATLTRELARLTYRMGMGRDSSAFGPTPRHAPLTPQPVSQPRRRRA